MNCYDFELNISAYIEGELKQAIRENFTNHKEACENCCEKLSDISRLMENLPQMSQLSTSSQFDQKLQNKIREIDNQGPSIWQRLIQLKPLGFEPVPALGFAVAMVMIIGASYLLLNQDGLPNIDFDKLSTQSKQNTQQKFEPSVITPTKNLPSMADSDTSAKSIPKHLENRIQLVGGK
ncbi:MAG: zf-HC2 domain-containing protein [Candidatus Marinimicrobia bacterium]|nr:zf-HC2 domain-containing protein [Candidatus Neomarinimicrobiota bacterium]